MAEHMLREGYIVAGGAVTARAPVQIELSAFNHGFVNISGTTVSKGMH